MTLCSYFDYSVHHQAMDQNKALSPSWNLCKHLAEVAIQNDNSKLTFQALGFMARWIQLGENGRPPIFHSVDEGLVISSIAAAARTYDSTLLDASWAILKRSLRERKPPNPETYLAKINALASLGRLQNAFSTLSELERTHASSTVAEEDLLSPFTSLHPLVVACSKQGFETLDLVSLLFVPFKLYGIASYHLNSGSPIFLICRGDNFLLDIICSVISL